MEIGTGIAVAGACWMIGTIVESLMKAVSNDDTNKSLENCERMRISATRHLSDIGGK